MSRRLPVAIVIAILIAPHAPALSAGQSRAPGSNGETTYTPPRTPWGDPDIQGIYTSDDLMDTPLQRAVELGDRLWMTNEELAKRAEEITKEEERAAQEFVAPTQRVTQGPPSHWGERPKRPAFQTSLIVDPANGRLPPLTALGEERRRIARDILDRSDKNPVSWEDFTYYIRCITRGTAGSILPSLYDNSTQIVQAPGYVVLLQEKVHEARVIPLGKRPHVRSGVRTILGDSRGHWEGGTLVVETTNFLDNKTGIDRNGGGPRTTEALRLTERFTKTGPNVVQYTMIVDDPKIYTRPWTLSFPIVQEPGYQVFEYTCHEANYAMTNSLSAARAEEQKAAEAAQQQR